MVLAVFSLSALILLIDFYPVNVVSGKMLGTNLKVPTAVIASDNLYHTKVWIHWDTIRGAAVYRIFRNTANSTAGATDVGTTPANYFFDTTAVVGQVYFYWVRAENGGTMSGFSIPDQGVRASGNLLPGAFLTLDPPPAPAGNPVTATKSNLGKVLFWDEQLSSTRTVACGTCHKPAEGGSDSRTGTNTRNPGPDNVFDTADDIFGSTGVPVNNADGTYTFSPTFGAGDQVTGRKSPSYLNSGYAANGLFWDGRATDAFRDPITNAVILPQMASLESQVLGPPVSSVEMAHEGRDWPQVAARISSAKPLALATAVPAALRNWINGRTYPELFAEAFGTPEVTPVRIALAIATHERTLFSDQTPLDRSITQIQPLQPLEEAGRELFVNLQCNVCHGDALLADHTFHNIGVRPQSDDSGRFSVTGFEEDRARFKTPTLRNVALHGPYMHNGRFSTLEDVIDFYNRGGDFDAPNIDRGNIRVLNLTPQEKDQLAAFMKRPLTDPRVANELPPFDRPKLYSDSVRVPVVFGTGRAGAGTFIPRVTAIEPALLGNPSFTVGVSNALGGAQAVLAIDSLDPGTGIIPASAAFFRQSVQLSGTGNGNGTGSFSISINAANTQFIGKSFVGRWYVTDPAAAGGFSYSPAFRFRVFGPATLISKPRADFDGDGKTDLSIFRPSVGQWWYLKSSDGTNQAFQFGAGTDKIVPADYTGDGKTDLAIFRPSSSEWFILRSEDNSFYSFPFGAAGDIPAPGDFDSDGKADPTVFRPSNATWFTVASAQGTLIRQFGTNGDIPQVGDYDGDGLADLAIYRPNGAGGSEWWINRSSAGIYVAQFGLPTDKPVIADYTGDGKTDIAFWRPSSGEWFILRSEDDSFYSAPFGISTDLPAPGDYDGDGKFDLAVFRQSDATWYINSSSQGFQIRGFGATEDIPAPGAFIP